MVLLDHSKKLLKYVIHDPELHQNAQTNSEWKGIRPFIFVTTVAAFVTDDKLKAAENDEHDVKSIRLPQPVFWLNPRNPSFLTFLCFRWISYTFWDLRGFFITQIIKFFTHLQEPEPSKEAYTSILNYFELLPDAKNDYLVSPPSSLWTLLRFLTLLASHRTIYGDRFSAWIPRFLDGAT